MFLTKTRSIFSLAREDKTRGFQGLGRVVREIPMGNPLDDRRY